mmetsp:Transcript_63498/g.169606  ORF Transcript_63498/g.169606 Transcript_63498/m.169606 type:complete len:228 (+) Transcript_63498:279-962(+)
MFGCASRCTAEVGLPASELAMATGREHVDPLAWRLAQWEAEHRAPEPAGTFPLASAEVQVSLASGDSLNSRGKLLGVVEGSCLGVGHDGRRRRVAKEHGYHLLLPRDALPGHVRLSHHGPLLGVPVLLRLRPLRRHRDRDHHPLAVEGPGVGAARGGEGRAGGEAEVWHVDGAALGHPALHADHPHRGNVVRCVQYGVCHGDLLTALWREGPCYRDHVGLHPAADPL